MKRHVLLVALFVVVQFASAQVPAVKPGQFQAKFTRGAGTPEFALTPFTPRDFTAADAGMRLVMWVGTTPNDRTVIVQLRGPITQSQTRKITGIMGQDDLFEVTIGKTGQPKTIYFAESGEIKITVQPNKYVFSGMVKFKRQSTNFSMQFSGWAGR
jgi:hypothetical protein